MPSHSDNRPESDTDINRDRRHALLSMGQFAVYVAPAMTVLLSGKQASAHHRPNHPSPCDNFPDSPFCTSNA